MAQLPEDELKQYDHAKNNGHASTNENNKNGFLCSRCDQYHDIADIFLWSKCRHQYSRACVTFTIRQQLYDEEYPSCIVGGCGQMLSQQDAELVLNEEIMYQFYNIYNMYHPQQIDDEKQQQQQNGQSPASLYQSLAPKLNLDDSDSDDINSQGITKNIDGPIMPSPIGRVLSDPKDESTDEDLLGSDYPTIVDKSDNENQPLLGSNGDKQVYGGYTQQQVNNMDPAPSAPSSFTCTQCAQTHHIYPYGKFEWSRCKHEYGRDCAEMMITMCLFEQKLPRCLKCEEPLRMWGAQELLGDDQLEAFKEILTTQATNDAFSTKGAFKANNDDDELGLGINGIEEANGGKKEYEDQSKPKEEAVKAEQSTLSNGGPHKQNGIINNTQNGNKEEVQDGIPNQDQDNEHKEETKEELKEDQEEKKDNTLTVGMSKKKKESKYIKMPSILMLPDNNYSALIPMPQDFIDDNGLQVLSTQKKQELNKKDMFYCCKCTQVISLHKDKSNGSFIALKCQHETCLKCAKAHTKHQMEILKTIPTCQVCPITITDEDLINIWGKFEATKLMDALFKEKSLKLPPFSPAMEVERALNGGENSNNNHDPNMNGFNGNHVQPNDDPPDRDINGNSRNTDANPAPIDDPNSNHNPASPTNPIPSTQNDEPIEVVQNGNGHNDHINDNNDNDKDEDGYGYCFTDGCQKKGKLNPNNSKDEQSRLNCAYCGVMWCIRCGCEWHLGQTCKQYQEDVSNFGMIYGQDQGNNNNDNIGNIGNVDHVFDKIMDGAFGDNEADDAFQELYQKNDWRTCPVCLSTIEKNDGCNRITCVCTTQFCWLCNQVLDPDTCMETHYGPESICSYR